MQLATEELRAAVLNARAAALYAEVSGMNAENMQRSHRGESMAYDDKAFYEAIRNNGLGENGLVIVAIHGDLA